MTLNFCKVTIFLVRINWKYLQSPGIKWSLNFIHKARQLVNIFITAGNGTGLKFSSVFSDVCLGSVGTNFILHLILALQHTPAINLPSKLIIRFETTESKTVLKMKKLTQQKIYKKEINPFYLLSNATYLYLQHILNL